MDLFEAHRRAYPLVVESDAGGSRPIAELFAIPGGVVFADVGWQQVGVHPFHVLLGEIRAGEDDWRVGDARIRIAFEGEQLFDELARWRRWRASAAGARYTPDLCLAEIRRSGILDPVDA